MLKNFWMDDTGAIVSIEMIIIITIAVLALIVGWAEVAAAVNSELDDISNAVGKLNQSYFFVGHAGFKIGGADKAYFLGSRFDDLPDECDSCSGASTIVCATLPPAVGGAGG